MQQNKEAIFYSRFILLALLLATIATAGSVWFNPWGLQKVVVTTQGGADHVFMVEVARSAEEKQTGLMFRNDLDEDSGMLFVYDRPQTIEMWMRNTHIPLDMIFIDQQGEIRKIAKDAEPYSIEIISSDVRVTSVLEVNAGITSRYNIQVGDKVVVTR